MTKDPFRVRRRMAKAAFFVLVTIVYTVLYVALTGGPDVASNLRECGIIIAPIIVCFTGVIVHYSHQVTKHDLSTIKQA